MTDILAPANLGVLERFALSNVLVAFDYDGTLAPIVQLPDQARMRSVTHRLLRMVARRYPCIVISGRRREDLAVRLGDVPVLHLAGNHGLQPWAEQAHYTVLVRGWVRQLDSSLEQAEGVVIEDKMYSVSVHYRGAADKRRAARAIEKAARGLPGARTIGGKQVLNIVPHDAPGKGEALERARRMLLCDTALYVGDDDTDEDVFARGNPDRLLSVRVGPASQSRARYLLRRQRDIDRLLRQLLLLRPERAAAS